jgi:hypothetical protein
MNVDCSGICGGTAVEDNCGTCDSDSSNDCVQDCAGIWGGDLVEDECGICGGDDSSCSDECGVPWGDNSSCSDECGVPWGDNLSCADCAGTPNGTAVIDDCGVCDTDTSNDCLDCSTYFLFEQSMSQAAYYFQEVLINGVTLSAEDLVAGFKGDICVGSQLWYTSLCV